MNIGCFKEAAEHFLAALSLHDDVGSGGENGGQGEVVHVSRTLWDTLHRNFIMVLFCCQCYLDLINLDELIQISPLDGEERFGRFGCGKKRCASLSERGI